MQLCPAVTSPLGPELPRAPRSPAAVSAAAVTSPLQAAHKLQAGKWQRQAALYHFPAWACWSIAVAAAQGCKQRCIQRCLQAWACRTPRWSAQATGFHTPTACRSVECGRSTTLRGDPTAKGPARRPRVFELKTLVGFPPRVFQSKTPGRRQPLYRRTAVRKRQERGFPPRVFQTEKPWRELGTCTALTAVQEKGE